VRERATAVLGRPAVAAALRVLGRYNAGGGGLLAGGLAYAALFAIVPAVVLIAGVVGLLYADPVEQERVVGVVVDVLPPLRTLIEAVLAEAARSAASVSIIGAVTLAWGTSRFVVAFQDAIGRVMGGDGRRGLVRANLGALAAVVLMIGAILASTLVSGAVEFLQAAAAAGVLKVVGEAIALSLGLLPVLATIAAALLVYRIVPVPKPAWRAVIVPGVLVGLALATLARAFAFLAPRLIGAAAFVGTLATVFAALAWLSLSFQAILFGAAWVRDRDARPAPETSPARR